jgi:hypothetical protein
MEDMITIRNLSEEQAYRLYFILEDRIKWLESDSNVDDSYITDIRIIQDKIYESLPENKRADLPHD